MASILVTDVAGSTELRTRLGEDAAEDLRRTHDRLLVDAVRRNAGTVVKGLGDGLLAYFEGAADALAAAVTIQRQVADHAEEEPGRAVKVRVGVSAGDVTHEDGDCFGAPVVEASRLCAAAEPGTILVADVVRVLARGRGGHSFSSVGELALKGLPDPVPASEIDWRPAATALSVPLPAALACVDRRTFAGRHAQRAALLDEFDAVKGGDRRLVLVAGEPGIGKSRLTGEVARALHRSGATVLHGRCDEYVPTPYGPFAEALSHLLDHAPEDLFAAQLDYSRSDLAHVVPSLSPVTGSGMPTSGSETERKAVFDAVAAVLERTAAQAPLVLVLDDLHWADRASVLLLRHLVRQDGRVPMLVVGTYRDTDVGDRDELTDVLRDLRAHPRCTHLALRGLAASEVEDLLAAATGQQVGAPTAALSAVLRARTEGNPLFIWELLAHLTQTGAMADGAATFGGDPADIARVVVPETVREVIARRVAALPGDTARLLGVAAVAGHEFDLNVVADVLDVAPARALDLVEPALAGGLVAELLGGVDRFRFTHALVQQALEHGMAASRRTRLHHAVATVLERSGRAGIEELAHHFCAGAAVADAAEAATYARRAGEEAMSRLAFEQAVEWFRRALEADDLCPPDTVRRCEILLALGRAGNLGGDVSAFAATFAEAANLARQADRPDLLGAAAVHYRGPAAVWASTLDPTGRALVKEALATLPEEETPLRVQLLLRRSHFLTMSRTPERRLDAAEEALRAARRIGDDHLTGLALYECFDARRGTTAVDEQLDIADELAELGRRTGDRDAPWRSLVTRSWTLMAMGRFHEAAALVPDLRLLAVTRRSTLARWSITEVESSVALQRGDWPEVDRTIEEARRFGVSVGMLGNLVAERLSMLVGQLRGTPGWDADVERFAVRWPAFVLSHPFRAEMAYQRGERDAALELLRAWQREWRPPLPYVMFLISRRYEARLSVALGELDRCRELIVELTPYRGLYCQAGADVMAESVEHILGLLHAAVGDVAAAEAHLRSAIAAYDAEDLRLWRAHAAFELAELLAACGDADRGAGRLLADAETAAADMDLQPLAARCRELRSMASLA